MPTHRVQLLPGAHAETWLVRFDGQPIGAIGFAIGDGRWRAAWQGSLVGDSYATREEAIQALIDRRVAAGWQPQPPTEQP